MEQEIEQPWHVKDRFLELRSPWLCVIGEHLIDNAENQLEYWRVEKADSIIILPIHADRILMPPPSYRPGIGRSTLDFPGGRLQPGLTPAEVAIAILQRELSTNPQDIVELTPLNSTGWPINSSFSNQKLFGFVATIGSIPDAPNMSSYPMTFDGLRTLLQDLVCLQCRAVLLEWLWTQRSGLSP